MSAILALVLGLLLLPHRKLVKRFIELLLHVHEELVILLSYGQPRTSMRHVPHDHDCVLRLLALALQLANLFLKVLHPVVLRRKGASGRSLNVSPVLSLDPLRAWKCAEDGVQEVITGRR